MDREPSEDERRHSMPLFFENVAMEGRLQSENPKILEALKKISA
jgi:hypothetical protein